jgi:hypothetical protein
MKTKRKIFGGIILALGLLIINLLFVPMDSDRKRAENDYRISFPSEEVTVRHNTRFPGVLGKYLHSLDTEIEMPVDSFNSWKLSYPTLKKIKVPRRSGDISWEYHSFPGMDYGISQLQRLPGDRVRFMHHASIF